MDWGLGLSQAQSPKREARRGGWLSGWKDGIQGCWCSCLPGGGPWMKEQVLLDALSIWGGRRKYARLWQSMISTHSIG